MSKIPIAGLLLTRKIPMQIGNELHDNGAWIIIEEALIEFAKLHVESAIKMCIEEAPSGSSTDTVSYKDVVNALKDCYPLTNIK